MSALDFDPWQALKIHPDGATPSNPPKPPNPIPDRPPRLGELGALGGVDGSEPKSMPAKDVGPWLLLRLWAYGATVAAGSGGALTITPHPSGRRIPGALIGAARRHYAALATWVGADPILPMRWIAGDGG